MKIGDDLIKTDKLWTKDFIVVFIINFSACLQFYLGMVVIPPYTLETFHASSSMAGLVSGIYVIGALFGRLGAGRIMGDLGSKKLLIFSSILYAITTVLYLPHISLLFLIINRLFNGIAYGVVATTATAIVAQIIPVSRHGEGISYYSLNSIVAMAVGPFLAILLVQYTSFKIIFLCNIVLAVVALILSMTNIQLVTTTKQALENTSKRFNISDYIESKVIPIGMVGLSIGLVYSSVLAFMSIYATQLHLETVASYFFLICAAVILLTRPISGRLFDAQGANIVLYPSLIILAVCMFLYAQVDHGIALLLSSVLFGLGWGNFHSCAQALSIKLTSPHRYGVATATYFILWEVGLGIGPYICGYLVQFTGFRDLYLIMGVVVITTIVLYYLTQGRKDIARKILAWRQDEGSRNIECIAIDDTQPCED